MNLWQPNGLLPLYSTHFCSKSVKRGDKLNGISGLENESSNVLLELDRLNPDEASIRDVFLMNKVWVTSIEFNNVLNTILSYTLQDTKKLYTGPYARHIKNLQKQNRWKAFVLRPIEITRDLTFERNMTIWYQVY